MSEPAAQHNENQKQQNGEESQQQPESPQQRQHEQDHNSLTEQDKKVYAQILGSINRMNKKIKNVKQKVPSANQPKHQLKRTSVNQIAEKLIQAKQNSDIVKKQDLITDVQQTFEQVVVNVYSENQQMKSKINSLIAIIKEQNKKMNEHKDKQAKLIAQNEKLREELMKIKDQHLAGGHHTGIKKPTNADKGSPNIKHTSSNAKNISNVNQQEDYDFWNMPNNESNVGKKRKQFVADSGLWVNDKDIDKSVFLTQQKGRR